MITDLLWVVLGLALLTGGGEILIRGALAAAERLGISPLLSGLLIVGFGTSAPELAVSVDAALDGNPDIALGNVVGSNIGNILLILGLCAMIAPLAVKPLALRRDGLAMVIATGLVMVLMTGVALSRGEAVVLLMVLAAYLFWAYQTERTGGTPAANLHAQEADELVARPRSTVWTCVAVLAGLGLLIAGSQALLKGAVSLAENAGLSQALIGLTLVAVGTSLPELAISVVAAFRRHADVAVGNILGSNIFNILGILGISALLQPLPINPRIAQFDQWVMLLAALLLLIFLYTGKRLNRWEGAVLLAGYSCYIGFSFVFFG